MKLLFKRKYKFFDNRWPFMILALVISSFVIFNSGLLGTEYDKQYTVVKGKVLQADNSKLSQDPYIRGMMLGSQPIEIKLLTGIHKGETFHVTNVLSRAFNIYCKTNKVILCNVREQNGVVIGVDVFGYNRDTFIFCMLALFALILILVGRKKGLYAMVSLAFTLVLVVFFMIPQILKGSNPIAVALLTAALTTVISILIISGPNKKGCAAIAGIVFGVGIAGTVACISGAIGNVTGIQMENAQEMIYLAQEMPIKVPDILFASVIISSLGAIMDIGISISSAIFELKAANEKLTTLQLYKSGMNIGSDVMGAMANTLILAFAGSSLITMIIITLYRLPFLRMINLDLLGVEFLQGISSCIGLILTIPITAIIAAMLAGRAHSQETHN